MSVGTLCNRELIVAEAKTSVAEEAGSWVWSRERATRK